MEDEFHHIINLIQTEYEKVVEHGDKPISIYLSKEKEKVTDKPPQPKVSYQSASVAAFFIFVTVGNNQ